MRGSEKRFNEQLLKRDDLRARKIRSVELLFVNSTARFAGWHASASRVSDQRITCINDLDFITPSRPSVEDLELIPKSTFNPACAQTAQMKATTRLFAVVTKKGNYLNAYTPTGLTGVVTHPAPRPHLMYMYNNTLDKLKQLPESSVYRQSVEALTRHRLAIVESQVPAGLEEWRTRVQAQIDANPQVFGPMGHAYKDKIGGKGYVISRRLENLDDRVEEWDGDRTVQRGEGPRAPEERLSQNLDLGNNRPLSDFQRSDVELEDEPPLSVEQ